ncbi:MAG: shikimate dehydrogenase [Planctomycetota bacterium]|nr:shikimate dehydrogenase [Planctomycetota bacterium]
MICVTVARTRHKHTLLEHQRLADEGAKLVEIRLDYIGRSIDLTRLLKNRPTPVVVTCRRKEDGGRWDRPEEERLMLLRSAIAMGVEYVDLEEDIADKIPRYGKTKRIVSAHNFEGTPLDLGALHDSLSKHDADIVKIATLANRFEDVIRMLDLMQNASVPTIGISMGDMGTLTRILASRFGAPFTYCVYSSERRVAPGQLTFDQMKNLYQVDEINEATKIFGVIADPVAHSYSPLIHNAAFAHQGLNARYIPFRVPRSELADFLRWGEAYGIGGLSVTIPHKESIIEFIHQAESAAKEIGAVNTVIFANMETVGYNTDYRAAMDCLTEAMAKQSTAPQPFKDKGVLMLGAGGVTRAIGYGLARRGAKVLISSRTQERSEALAQEIGGKALPWASRYDVKPDIIVNGSPLGMFPDIDSTPYDGKKLEEHQIVFDTVYNPEQTMLVKAARGTGCTVITGLQMFIRQAAYQYRLFTGKEPPVDVMMKTLQRAISPLNYRDQKSDDDAEDASTEAKQENEGQS